MDIRHTLSSSASMYPLLSESYSRQIFMNSTLDSSGLSKRNRSKKFSSIGKSCASSRISIFPSWLSSYASKKHDFNSVSISSVRAWKGTEIWRKNRINLTTHEYLRRLIRKDLGETLTSVRIALQIYVCDRR